MAAAVVLTLIAFVLPFQEAQESVKYLVEIKKPIGTVGGIIALVCGVLAILMCLIGKKVGVLVFGFLDAGMILLMIMVNKSHKLFGMKIPVDNKIGFVLCWVALVVTALATLFAYVTTPKGEKQ